ncbi:MAG: head GIN domain-containing protein [Allosphingosinicella sp.]
MRLAILGAVLTLGACTSANGQSDEARPTGERSFPVGAFQSVSLEGSHDVIVTAGDVPSVRAQGDTEALERLEVAVEGDTLRIGSRRGRGFSWHRARVTVYVTTPTLRGAFLRGSGDLRIDRVQTETFEASIAGSGDIDIVALQARRANFSIAGSGGVRAAGAADETDIDIAGSGNARLDALAARRASVSVAGSGNINVRASETVDGSIMGSGNLRVHGPARCSVSKMGSGNISCDA